MRNSVFYQTNEHCSFVVFVCLLEYNLYRLINGGDDMSVSLSGNQLQDKVTQICNDLYAKGQKVSVRIVLSMLPDVSSTSTVHKYYKAWKDELEANQKSLLEKMGFSEEFTRVFMAEITRHATEAERRYREIAEDAKEQSLLAIDDLERAEDRLYKQTALLEQREKQIKEVEAELAQADKSQQAITQELRQQIENLTEQLNESTASNERLRTELAKNELLLESNKELVVSTKTQNTELSDQIKQLNGEVVELSKTITRLESAQESKQELIEELKSSKLSTQEQNQQLDRDLRDTQQERSTLQASLSDAKASLSTNSQRLEQAQSEVVELKTNVKQYLETIRHYEGLLSKE